MRVEIKAWFVWSLVLSVASAIHWDQRSRFPDDTQILYKGSVETLSDE